MQHTNATQGVFQKMFLILLMFKQHMLLRSGVMVDSCNSEHVMHEYIFFKNFNPTKKLLFNPQKLSPSYHPTSHEIFIKPPVKEPLPWSKLFFKINVKKVDGKLKSLLWVDWSSIDPQHMAHISNAIFSSLLYACIGIITAY